MRDNGVGLNGNNGNDPAGFGLRGLRERAAQLDGNLVVKSFAQGGTQFVLTLPLSSPVSASDDEDTHD